MSTELFGLDGHVVIVTGGLGQLGQQFTRALLEYGAKVAVVDLPDAGELAEEFVALGEEKVIFVGADITDREALVIAEKEIEERLGMPYGLINNAALDSSPGASAEENGPFETYPEESFRKVMEVNVTGIFLACQVFGEAMAKMGRGSIVNIGSTYGMVSPDQSVYEYRRQRGETFYKPVAYATSKSALFNFTRYLASYWGGQGVRANVLSFGGVFNNQDQEFLDNYCGRVPMGRMADEAEYNGAVIFLMSQASSYMTGSNMVIDGGWTAI